MSSRAFTAWFLVTTVAVAAGLRHVASSHPDGLEHVAGSIGFLDAARDSVTSGSPLAGYTVAGMGNAHLSAGLAGVLGCLATFAVAALLTMSHNRHTKAEP